MSDRGIARLSHVPWVGAGAVFVGGVLGTLARQGVTHLVGEGHGFPLGVLVVNLIGAFLLGWLLDALASRPGTDAAGRREVTRLLAGTGFCGSFTTWSGIVAAPGVLTSLDAPDAWWLAANLLGGCAAAWLGMVAAGRGDA